MLFLFPYDRRDLWYIDIYSKYSIHYLAIQLELRSSNHLLVESNWIAWIKNSTWYRRGQNRNNGHARCSTFAWISKLMVLRWVFILGRSIVVFDWLWTADLMLNRERMQLYILTIKILFIVYWSHGDRCFENILKIV